MPVYLSPVGSTSNYSLYIIIHMFMASYFIAEWIVHFPDLLFAITILMTTFTVYQQVGAILETDSVRAACSTVSVSYYNIVRL